jgi:homoserine kinase
VNSASISVPASSANLGPGFDTLALALDLRLRVNARWSSDTVRLNDFDNPLSWWRAAVEPGAEHRGTLAGLQLTNAPNILASAFVRAVLRAGPEYHLPRELSYRADSRIPVAQGLGSSAAAAVVGAALAEVWRGREIERLQIFQDAVEIEGHADNAAAATYGGLQAALLLGRESRAAGMEVHDSVRVALCVPRLALKDSTADTRSRLPDSLGHGDAVSNQRALLTLLYGLRRGDSAAIAAGMEDRLHVAHRSCTIAGYEDVVNAAVEAGACGCTISGAGGALIAIGMGEMGAVSEAMRQAFKRNGVESQALTPDIDKQGLIIESPQADSAESAAG